jgi:hypothetical protein
MIPIFPSHHPRPPLLWHSLHRSCPRYKRIVPPFAFPLSSLPRTQFCLDFFVSVNESSYCSLFTHEPFSLSAHVPLSFLMKRHSANSIVCSASSLCLPVCLYGHRTFPYRTFLTLFSCSIPLAHSPLPSSAFTSIFSLSHFLSSLPPFQHH